LAQLFNQNAVVPLQGGKIQITTALDRGSAPVKDFNAQYAREKDLALFVELSKEARPKKPSDLSMRVVVPAYIISELKAGFQIGAVVVLAFSGDRYGGGFYHNRSGHDAVASGL